MKFALPLFLATVAYDSAAALGDKNTLRGRRQLKKLEDTCIASIVDVQYEDRTDDQFMTCETPSGKSYKVKAADKDFIKKNFGNGKLMSGEVELTFDADAMIDESTAEIISKSPPGLSKKKNNNGKGPHGRQLQTKVGNCGTYIGGSCAGTRSVLVVRVIAADKATTASESQLAESIFENPNDSLNLQSWYKQCSYNQLNFVPATGTGINGGVTTVTVPSSTTQGDSVMNNDIVTALNAQFNVSSPDQIANHVMYCLPAGTMSGIAYANINNWRSVYSDNWCTYVSAQAHEIGHNLLLAHSGDPAAAAGSSSETYGDQSGMMGFSYSNDDGPRQCFNAPKNWQLGWYDDRKIPVSYNGWEGNLIGISEISNAAPGIKVIARANLDESYYVSFNRKTGINSGTVEGGNQVMVHKRAFGNGYAESDVLAYLNSGGTYSSPDGKFKVTVNGINLTTNPATANVKIERFDSPPDCFTGTASVSITPDNYAGETSWDIRDDVDNVLASGNYLGASNIVLPNGPSYFFSIYDSYGDGICCAYGNGFYTFQVGSTVVKTGGEFGSQETTRFGICNNVSPTAAPTAVPTSAPTSSPTASPTKSPTPNPTVPPTNAPTASPTNAPSTAPTSAPTTASPTASPTKSPTPNPTSAPTSAPSSAPTSSPTASPTKSPTPNPTLPPTLAPTKAPTNAPTSSPTEAPTKSPTPNPTAPPTLAPTNAPSSAPTSSPTAAPTTAAPTSSPTKAPTQPPTLSPTKSPTIPPTPAPTVSCSNFNGNKNGCIAAPNCSYSNKNKTCVSNGPAPTAGPPTAEPPTAEPPTTGGPGPNECPICAATGEECCGRCVDSGKPSNRGCFL